MSGPNLNLVHASRSIAPLLIMINHAIGLLFPGDHIIKGIGGVDFFFVLSGFMIYYVYHSKLSSLDGLKSYAVKRIVRIYPFYWVVFLCVLPIYLLFPSFGVGYETRADVMLASFLLLPSNYHVVGVAWSLSYTVFFYAAFAFTFSLSSRIRHLIVPFYIATILMLGSVNKPFVLDFLFNVTHLEMIAGCIMAATLKRWKKRSGPLLLILGFMLYAISVANGAMKWEKVPSILSFGIPAVLILAGIVIIDLRKSPNIPKLISTLGNASYSIFLTHYFTISAGSKALKALGPINEYAQLIILIGLALLVGWLAHIILEKPLQNLLLKPKKTQAAVSVYVN